MLIVSFFENQRKPFWVKIYVFWVNALSQLQVRMRHYLSGAPLVTWERINLNYVSRLSLVAIRKTYTMTLLVVFVAFQLVGGKGCTNHECTGCITRHQSLHSHVHGRCLCDVMMRAKIVWVTSMGGCGAQWTFFVCVRNFKLLF